MTDDGLPLAELLQKAGDGDFLRAVAEAVLQILTESDVQGLPGAGRHERSPERLNHRNGQRDRTLDTRLGQLRLRIAELRQGCCFPPFLEPRKTSEKAPAAAIREAWIAGVSPRRVDELIRAMGPSGIGRSRLSELRQEIDGRVGAFPERPRRRMALSLAGCDLPEGSRRRSDRPGGGDDRRGGRHRRQARDHRPRPWSLGRGNLLVDLPRGAGPAWSEGCRAGDPRRARGARACRRRGARGDVAALPGSWAEMRPGPCPQRSAHDGGRGPAAGFPAARSRHRPTDLAAGRRPAPPPLARAGDADGRRRARRAGVHGLSRPASHQAAQHTSTRKTR